MSGLPSNWVLCTVEDVTTTVSRIEPDQSPDREIGYVDISSIDNVRNRIGEPKRMPLGSAPSRARQIIMSGDVLFATVRPYLRNIAQVPDNLNGEVASTGFAVLRAATGVDPRYLFYKAISRDFVAALTGEQYGVSYPAVKDEQVRSRPFELPPTFEQHRIVAKIEELFSELDKGIESLTASRAQLKAYRQALLKHAFEGKLTADWRARNRLTAESTENLLSRIWQERTEIYERAASTPEVGKRLLKPKNLLPVSSAEAKCLTKLPEGWTWARIGQIGSIGTGATPLKSRNDYYENGTVPWVTSGALNDAFITQPTTYITEKALAENNLRMFPAQTLLIALYGEGKTRGKCSELKIQACTNQAISAVVIDGTASGLRRMLKWYLVKNYEEVRLASSGGVQPNLNNGLIENMPVPICQIAEAEAIADWLDEKDLIIQRLTVLLEESQVRVETLRQSILKQAFAGQLVPQDPSDEPASMLLERIRAEREAVASKPRKPTKRSRGEAA